MRNYRNLALTNPTNLRPNYIQSPIHHVVTQLSQNDNTYEQTIEQPHTFQSQNNHFSAHDEQTNWIPSPFKFPSCQNPFPIIPLFAFPPPDSPHNNTSFGMNSYANSDIDAIQKLQPPTNKKKIQEFLGMSNFLIKYVYKMQLYFKPLYNILRQQNNFEWTTEH